MPATNFLINMLAKHKNIRQHVQEVSERWKQNLSNARNLAYKRAYKTSIEIENILKNSFSVKASKALVNYLVWTVNFRDVLPPLIISPWETLKKENPANPQQESDYLLKIKDVVQAAQNYAEKIRLLWFIKQTEHYLDEQTRKKVVLVNRVLGSSSHNALKSHGVVRTRSELQIRKAFNSSQRNITESTKRNYPGFHPEVHTFKGPFNTKEQTHYNRKGKGKANLSRCQ